MIISNFQKAEARRRRVGRSPLSHYSLFVIHSSPRSLRERGFTLLELVIVVAIIAILGLAVTLVLEPAQMMARARDNTRLTDFNALTDAIELARADAPLAELGGFDADGTLTDSCVGESSQTVYVSVTGIDINGTCAASPPDDLPTGWSYRCAPNDGPQDVDGTGWLPVNFTAGGGTPAIERLPIDPANTFASGFYYSYVCSTGGEHELTARLTSERMRTGGPEDKASNDGGDDIFMLEMGSDLALNPKSPAGYWAFDEGSGTVTADNSGNGHNGNLINQTAWITGVRGTGLTFDGTTDRVDLTGTLALDPIGFTITHWLKTDSALGQLYTVGNAGGGDGYRFGITAGRMGFLFGDGGYTEAACGATTVNDDAWHQITGVYESSSTFSCYIDGAFEASVAVGSYSNMQTNAPDFGAPPCCQDLDGEMDEVAIYDRVLTAQEVAYQYEALKP